MFTEEDKEKVRGAIDLVALVAETVELKPRGSDLWGCCPFHHEKSPSFHIVPSRGLWHCFGCGKGGDCFDYVMDRDHLAFPDAVRYLAERAGITLADDGQRSLRAGSSKRRLYEAMDAAAGFYHLQLTRVRGEGPDAARAYLAGRGFGSAVSERWNLGYAPGGGSLVQELTKRGFSRQELIDARLATQREDGTVRDAFYNRVIFPICDERGQVVALGGRIMGPKREGVPKYINSRDSSVYSKRKTMFALDRAKAHITARQEVIIEEGYTDVICSHEAGIDNATAACGTSLTPEHVRMLDRFLRPSGMSTSRGRIICMFDGDEAGLKAAERALSLISLTSAAMYCVILPDGQDPAEYLGDHSADDLRALLADPEPLARFVIDRHFDRFDVSSPEGRASALADITQAMAPLKDTSLAGEYCRYVAGRMMLDEATVTAALDRVRKPDIRPEQDDDGWASGPQVVQPLGQDQVTGQADLVLTQAGGRRSQAGRAQTPMLPEDAHMVRVEREVLSAVAQDVAAAQPFAARLADVSWADPCDQAIAWAVLSLPPTATALQALGAAEAVVPEAASILSEGTLALTAESDDARALSILVDALEMLSIRRKVKQKTAQLRTTRAGEDPEAYERLFQEVSGLQVQMRELEDRQRTTK